MKKATRIGFISLVLATTISTPVAAQLEEQETPPSTSTETAADLTITPRLGIGHTTSGGGFDGFTRFEGFVPLLQKPGNNLTFLEGRLLLDNDANLGGNILLGYRTYDPNSRRIWGGYIGYDNRNTGNNTFNQIGLGAESLGEIWDFHINAYLPIGDNRQEVGDVLLRESFFRENFLILDQQRNQEAAMGGFDVEAGARIAQLGREGDLRGYGGLYYYNAQSSQETLGWRLRLQARPTDYLNLGVSLQNDDLFGTNIVFTVGATFPGTRPQSPISEEESVVARLGESVQRNNAIVIDHQEEVNEVAATNPETDEPYVFQHVNLGIAGGDGTFENPVGTVQEGLDRTLSDGNNIVYVQPGTNSGIPPFTIPDQVQVLSTGPVQRLETVESDVVQLPLSGARVLPTITPSAEASVTMGNGTTLSGFDIPNAGTSAIEGTNINTVTIRDNVIANSTQQGILLTEVTGTITVTDNSIDTTGGIGNSGFALRNTAESVNLTIARNRIANTTGNGIAISLTNTAEGTANISDNTLSGNQFNGIGMTLEGDSQGTANISDNTLSGNQFNGIGMDLEDNSFGTISILSNTISSNQSNGIGVGFDDTAQGTFTINNNTISQSDNNGIFARVLGNSTSTLTIDNNAISDNGNVGIAAEMLGNSTLTLTIDNNTVSDNGTVGIGIQPQEFTTSTATIANNAVSGNGTVGLAAEMLGNSTSTLTIDNNTVSGNGTVGIVIQPQEFTTSTTTIANNTVSSNGTFGITSQMSGNSTSTLTIDNNTVSDNGTVGIGINPNEFATSTATITNNTVSGNGFNAIDTEATDGIITATEGDSSLQLLLEGNSATDNARFGLSIVANDNSQIFAGVRFNTLTGNPGSSDPPFPNSFGAQTGSPDNLTTTSTICLDLRNNTSDNGFVLNNNRPLSTFQANTTANTGVIAVPGLPVEPLGDCPVP